MKKRFYYGSANRQKEIALKKLSYKETLDAFFCNYFQLLCLAYSVIVLKQRE